MVKRGLTRIVLGLCLLLAGPVTMLIANETGVGDWRTRSNAPLGVAPTPEEHPEALVQIWAARAYGWRGAFGVHSWVAVKPERDLDQLSHHRLARPAGRGWPGAV